jgi:hypothetical protein
MPDPQIPFAKRVKPTLTPERKYRHDWKQGRKYEGNYPRDG